MSVEKINAEKIASVISNAENVTQHFHAPTTLKEQSLPKKLPYSFPNPVERFTGRLNVLEAIKESLKNHRKASLSGTHGLGKSSIVKEFAHYHWKFETTILFVVASKERFNSDVRQIVFDLGLESRIDATETEILKEFRRWLATNKDWLLILDNINNVEQIQKANIVSMNGFVLLTSNKDEVHRLGNKIHISNMPDNDAAVLIYRHYKQNSDVSIDDIPITELPDLKKVANKFGNLPIAMAWVGAYIAQEQETIIEFLENYSNSQANILREYEGLAEYEHKEVATAYLQTFKRITTPTNETAEEKLIAEMINNYLKLCVYLSPDNIPEELLEECAKCFSPEESELSKNKFIFKETRKRLSSYGLFERNAHTKTLSTHRLLQEVMFFEINNEKERIIKIIGYVLNNFFPQPTKDNLHICDRYLLNVQIFLLNISRIYGEPLSLYDKGFFYEELLFTKFEIYRFLAKEYNLPSNEVLVDIVQSLRINEDVSR